MKLLIFLLNSLYIQLKLWFWSNIHLVWLHFNMKRPLSTIQLIFTQFFMLNTTLLYSEIVIHLMKVKWIVNFHTEATSAIREALFGS